MRDHIDDTAIRLVDVSGGGEGDNAAVPSRRYQVGCAGLRWNGSEFVHNEGVAWAVLSAEITDPTALFANYPKGRPASHGLAGLTSSQIGKTHRLRPAGTELTMEKSPDPPVCLHSTLTSWILLQFDPILIGYGRATELFHYSLPPNDTTTDRRSSNSVVAAHADVRR
jgi:hypothetical protein